MKTVKVAAVEVIPMMCGKVTCKHCGHKQSAQAWGARQGEAAAHRLRGAVQRLWQPDRPAAERGRLTRHCARGAPVSSQADPKESTMSHLTCGYTAATVHA